MPHLIEIIESELILGLRDVVNAVPYGFITIRTDFVVAGRRGRRPLRLYIQSELIVYKAGCIITLAVGAEEQCCEEQQEAHCNLGDISALCDALTDRLLAL